jgi:hypothetical protein
MWNGERGVMEPQEVKRTSPKSSPNDVRLRANHVSHIGLSAHGDVRPPSRILYEVDSSSMGGRDSGEPRR